jgi:CheY-like chemotaxis protein
MTGPAPRENITERVLREDCIVSLSNHTALLTRDGRMVPIEDSAAPIRDAAGKVAGVVLVFHDITERRRSEAALQSAHLDLERRVRARRHGSREPGIQPAAGRDSMDVSMPILSGSEVTRRICTVCPDTRVIGLSMFEDSEQAQAMRDTGAVAYLTRSDPTDALLAAIRGDA